MPVIKLNIDNFPLKCNWSVKDYYDSFSDIDPNEEFEEEQYSNNTYVSLDILYSELGEEKVNELLDKWG